LHAAGRRMRRRSEALGCSKTDAVCHSFRRENLENLAPALAARVPLKVCPRATSQQALDGGLNLALNRGRKQCEGRHKALAQQAIDIVNRESYDHVVITCDILIFTLVRFREQGCLVAASQAGQDRVHHHSPDHDAYVAKPSPNAVRAPPPRFLAYLPVSVRWLGHASSAK